MFYRINCTNISWIHLVCTVRCFSLKKIFIFSNFLHILCSCMLGKVYRSSIFCSTLTHSLSPIPKSKKKPPRKKFLIFQEMELSSSNIKKILIFSEMKPCSFQPWASKFSLKKFLIFFLKKLALKKFLIFSQKNAFLIFSKM